MAALEETETYEEHIYQLEITDPVIAGPNGISNLPLKQLASRTKFLKTIVDSIIGGAFEAAKAIKLSTARKISLGGILSGYANFDGSADISLNASIADGALSIAKTNGLQAALDSKISSLSDASQTVKGIIEIATNAEVQAGIDTTRAVTPAGLFSIFTNSKSGNGYIKLPNGLILQWGNTGVVSANVQVTVTFPIAFTTVTRVGGITTVTGTDAYVSASLALLNSTDLASFKFHSFNATGWSYNWIAIGY